MSFRSISAEMGINVAPYVAGLNTAAAETKVFAADVTAAGKQADAAFTGGATAAKSYAAAATIAADATKKAETNVAALARRNTELAALKVEYEAIAASAEAGSARQVAAARLVEVSNKRLVATGAEVEAANRGIGESVSGVVGFIENLGVKVQNSSGIIGSALKGITADASALSVGVGAGVAAAVVGFGALAVSGIGAYQKLGDQTRILMGVTGATAEQASSLIFTFNQIGVSTDTLTLSFARFGKNIADTPSKFDALGVAIAHTSTGAADSFATFENLKRTFDATGDAATRDAIVMDLLGRGASGLIPYLRLTTDELKRFNAEAQAMGQQLSGQDVEATRQFGIATKELHSSLSELGIMAAREVLPSLTALASGAVTGFHLVGEGVSEVGKATSGMGLFSRVLHDVNDAALITSTAGLAAIPLALRGHSSASKQAAADTQNLVKAYAAYGVALSDTDAEQIIADKSQKQLESTVGSFKMRMSETAASVGLSVTGMTADIGVFGNIAPEDFAKVEKAAKDFTTAVEQAANASSAAFLKTVDAVAHFSASSLEQAASASTKAANTVEKDDTRVADAIQHVADLQEQYAEQAATAREAYANKVEQTNQRLVDAEQSYADTVDNTNQRIADADRKLADDRISSAQTVADAERRLEEDRANGAQSVADARQRLADDEARQALSRNPGALKRLNDEIQLRDARAAIARAQDAAADKERSDLDAIAKAKENQIRTLQADQEAADKARVDGARAIEKAEDAVTQARKEQAKVEEEGLHLGELTLAQQREMRKAVEAVGKAQEASAQQAVAATEKVTGAVSVSVADVQKFYADSLAQGQTFAEGIRTAIERGYDPQFISRLLQEGPKEAAPLLAAIVGDHDNTLRNLVNASESAVKGMNFSIRETARLTEEVVHSSNSKLNSEFDDAMRIMEANAASGGTRTSDALARELGIGVERVRQIDKDFGLGLIDGLNPVLSGVGAPRIQLGGASDLTGDTDRGFHALGGLLPGHGGGDSLPIMAEPGEFIFSVAAVDRIGAQNLDRLHQEARRGYASGGFVTASDVPPAPDLSMYGTAIGYTGDKVNQFARDKVIEYLNGAGSRSYASGSGSDDFEAVLREIAREKGLAPFEVDDLRIIGMGESGGRNIAQGIYDINSANGTPAFGPFQIIEPTFNTYKDPGHGDWHDPVDSGDAAVNYARSRYGSLENVPGVVAVKHGRSYVGYSEGGLVEALGRLNVGSNDAGGYLEPGWNLRHNGLGVREPVGVTAGWGGPSTGGDVIVNVTVNGPALGTTGKQIAETLAGPLRAEFARRGQSVSGNYLSRNG